MTEERMGGGGDRSGEGILEVRDGKEGEEPGRGGGH